MDKNIEELIGELNNCTSISDLYQKRLSNFYYGKNNEEKTEYDFVLTEYKIVSPFYFEFMDISKKNNSWMSSFLKFEEYYDFLDSKQRSLEPFYKNLDASKLKGGENEKQLSFKNNFDNVNESVIIKYFTEALVDKKYLSALELKEFLIAAFEKKTPPTNRFSFNNIKNLQQIVNVFYNYFKNIAGKPYGKKKQYVELLGEYFVGFNTINLMTNFSK